MNTKRLPTLSTLQRPAQVLCIGGYFLLSHFAFPQGNIIPTTAPTLPIMKTLDQVEPRKDIATLSGDASNQVVISAAGSYYLTSNLGATKINGIHITVAGVTVDLNGFQISRSAGSGGSGVLIDSVGDRCTIKNGAITGFFSGIGAPGSRACLFRSLTVSNCSDVGFNLGQSAVIESCRAVDNGNSGFTAGSAASLTACTAIGNALAGISADNNSTLTNCSAQNNSAGGIAAFGNSTLTNCVASNNGGVGIFASGSLINCSAVSNNGTHGIQAGNGTVLTGCSANSNTATIAAILVADGCSLTNCSAQGNTTPNAIVAGEGCSLANCAAHQNTSTASISAGFNTGIGCTITNCSATRNTSTAATFTSTTGVGFIVGSEGNIQGSTASINLGDGIRVFGACTVRHNNCTRNGSGSGDGAGIHALGSGGGDNRIESNNVIGNDRGIDVDTTGNFITKNTASGNTNNWDVVSGNVLLVVSATTAVAVSGNSGGVAPGSTDPNANFSY